jgi:hypothetical protein
MTLWRMMLNGQYQPQLLASKVRTQADAMMPTNSWLVIGTAVAPKIVMDAFVAQLGDVTKARSNVLTLTATHDPEQVEVYEMAVLTSHGVTVGSNDLAVVEDLQIMHKTPTKE